MLYEKSKKENNTEFFIYLIKNNTIMKKILLFNMILFFGIFTMKAQFNINKIKPVKWTHSHKKLSKGKVQIMMKAEIDEGWHLYSQYFDTGGPIRLNISFEGKNIEIIGKTKEQPNPKNKHDDIFDINVKYFYSYALFTQKIGIKKNTKKIRIIIEGQACRENDGVCVQVKEEYVFEL